MDNLTKPDALDPRRNRMQSILSVLTVTDQWLGKLGPYLLCVFAFFYYQQYYMSGLNLGGEGGTNAVIAMRLMEGQRPIADTFLGYNVLWFYPLVWVFEIFGPDFTAMRIFFYVLSTLTGVLVFATIRKVTALNILALAASVLVILLPGMLFRNYIGLLATLNVFVLLSAFVFEPSSTIRQFVWYVVSGLTLGVTYLTRIDIGVFFTPITLGAALFWPLAARGQFWRRTVESFSAILTIVLVASAIHVPFWLDSRSRGFEENFLGQYRGIWGLIEYEAKKQIFDKLLGSDEPSRDPSFDESSALSQRSEWQRVANTSLEPADVSDAGEGGGTRPRPPISAIFTSGSIHEASFVVALYLPVAVSVVILLFSGAGLITGIFRMNAELKRDSLTAGITLGGALTLFPQFFFFRPDLPHLAEFRIPFLVAAICASFLAVRWFWPQRQLRVPVILFIIACATSEASFFNHAYWKESSGSVRVMHNRTAEFIAENGVRAMVRKRDIDWMNNLRDAVMDHSDPKGWVVTFPYSPTINFMTNRRSYLYNLYVDNVTAPQDFHERTVSEIQTFRPEVIVIDDRAINNTEASRFSNWASRTHSFIADTYVPVWSHNTLAVYVRPDKVKPKMEIPDHPLE